LAASLGGQGKHSAHQERMKATVSWKLDKETFVFSSLVWFSTITLLSLPGKCPQTQQKTLCFFCGGWTGLLQPPTPDTLCQSPAESAWTDPHGFTQTVAVDGGSAPALISAGCMFS